MIDYQVRSAVYSTAASSREDALSDADAASSCASARALCVALCEMHSGARALRAEWERVLRSGAVAIAVVKWPSRCAGPCGAGPEDRCAEHARQGDLPVLLQAVRRRHHRAPGA